MVCKLLRKFVALFLYLNLYHKDTDLNLYHKDTERHNTFWYLHYLEPISLVSLSYFIEQ